jgi:uncharacterized phiE125 gp8 family phage protein
VTIPTSLVRSVAPTDEPVALAALKLHLRVDVDDDNAQILRMLAGVRGYIETYLNRALLTQTWVYTLDAFADEMALPMAAPLQSVTSVKYYDTSGVQQTLSTAYYHIDAASLPARLVLAPTKVWPSLQAQRTRPVEITYVVGWESEDDIPGEIIDAIYLLVGDRYQHRENVVTGYGSIAIELPGMASAKALLTNHRVPDIKPVCA